jgi:hypothetical protein
LRDGGLGRSVDGIRGEHVEPGGRGREAQDMHEASQHDHVKDDGENQA